MMLDWLIGTDSGDTYQKIKEKAQERVEWAQWNLGPT